MQEALLAPLNEKNKNVCFTGPSPNKLPENGDMNSAIAKKIALVVQ